MRTLSSAVFYFPDCYDGLDGESFDAGELLHGSDGSKNAERVCVFCLTVVLISLSLIVACDSVGTEPLPGEPAHHADGGFRNTDPNFYRPSGWTRWNFVVRRLLLASTAPRTFDAPRIANDGAALRAGLVNPSITWIGHATLLVQLDGINFLTDPHWGERASPLSWAGLRKFATD